jgi:hypothetical protein
MYKPVEFCGRCSRIERPRDGKALLNLLLQKKRKYDTAVAASLGGIDKKRKLEDGSTTCSIKRTQELYVIPRLSGDRKYWATECRSFPRYHNGKFSDCHCSGESILELTTEEQSALQIVCLRTNVKAEKYGGANQLNWKKVGLSRAYFKNVLVTEAGMPTPRAAAAFVYLLENNEFYKAFAAEQKRRIGGGESLNLSSFSLFIQAEYAGIECAMFPHLYPKTAFTDTGIMKYRNETDENDTTNRIVSIARSWTRKCLSSVRVYAEQRDLTFFLYEKWMALKFYWAHVRAQKLGITADILMRDSQASSGYWEGIQDALADLVRIQLDRCFDEEGHPDLHRHCRDLRGRVWMVAFPNVSRGSRGASWPQPQPQSQPQSQSQP